MKAQTTVRTLTDLADKLGISRQTVHKYARMKGFPKSGRNGFDVAAVGDFILAHSRKGDIASRDILKILRARKLSLENQLIELKVNEANGELMPRAEHQAKFLAIALVFMRAIETLQARIAAVTRDPKISELVRKECESAIQNVRAQLVDSDTIEPPEEGIDETRAAI